MLDQFLFVGLPYTSVIILIIGVFIRLKYFGYTVTSHSSQFLESNKLFWGSRLFHIGIVTLLLGHIIGFMIPKSIIYVTSIPLGLLVIELSAFSFAVLSFVGVTLLLIRRIIEKRLYKVTSKMDILIYSLIFIQVLTGILVAYYYRWGTGWYASSLVPYLYSILYLSPNIASIAAMPLLIKIHAASAFVFIGLIPFSRLIHFLVYPIYYLWRNYIVVIWNRDLKESRASAKTREGIKPINN
jgi:nitrate reductase gamma subunit